MKVRTINVFYLILFRSRGFLDIRDKPGTGLRLFAKTPDISLDIFQHAPTIQLRVSLDRFAKAVA